MIKCKKHYGFTFVEVVLVMALISFLYIITTKVIEHNLEQKVPLYVYNLYKNLDNEGKLLTKELLSEANGNQGGGGNSLDSNNGNNGGNGDNEEGVGSTTGGNESQDKSDKTIEDVLKRIDAKGYCEAFAKDTNLMGDEIDCTNSIHEQIVNESLTKNIEYDCTRSYQFTINDNTSKYNEIYTPSYNSALKQCSNNNDFDASNISCNATPRKSISNLLISNTEKEHTYNCSKINETIDKNNNIDKSFDIDKKPQLSKSIVTLNNIHLNFATLIKENDIYNTKYNLYANINQEAICPIYTFPTTNDITCTDTFYFCINSCTTTGADASFQNCKNQYVTEDSMDVILNSSTPYINTQWPSILDKYFKVGTNEKFKLRIDEPSINNMGNPNYQKHCKYENNIYTSFIKYSLTLQSGGLDLGKTIETSSFQLNYDNPTCDNLIASSLNFKDIATNGITSSSARSARGAQNQMHGKIVQTINFKDEDKITYFSNYYTKWSKFFDQYKQFTKATVEAINGRINEGVFENNDQELASEQKDYFAHLIYASIDMPFLNGEIGKNIFVFEHYIDKIIPVGYLANNEDTPLKFNVITRNPNTYKIEKINDKPLTYCEAMKYTGEKFSQYCGCKDENNNIVTQYTRVEACDNHFGCMIQPIKPSSVATKFKLF